MHFRDLSSGLLVRMLSLPVGVLALQGCAPSVVGRHMVEPSAAVAYAARDAARRDSQSNGVRVVYHYFESSTGPHADACTGPVTWPKDSAHYGVVICRGDQPIAFAAYNASLRALASPQPGSKERRRLAEVAAGELMPQRPVIALQ